VALTYVKAGRKPSTVTVEPADASVTVVTRDGNHAPRVDHCPADDPASLAEGIGRDLLDAGYTLAA
jgi:hypothetical protein